MTLGARNQIKWVDLTLRSKSNQMPSANLESNHLTLKSKSKSKSNTKVKSEMPGNPSQMAGTQNQMAQGQSQIQSQKSSQSQSQESKSKSDQIRLAEPESNVKWNQITNQIRAPKVKSN